MKNVLERLLKPTKLKRTLFFLVMDCLLLSSAFILSFLLRFDFSIPKEYKTSIIVFLPIFVFLKIGFFYLFKIYSFNWRYISLKELFRISYTLLISSAILFFANLFLQYFFNSISIPKSVVIIDFFLSLVFVGFLRILKRIYLELFSIKKLGKRTLIIVAGTTGERIARALLKEPSFNPIK
jgi:UDP-N-acetyl-D-glucosamine 4,6-dehydratase